MSNRSLINVILSSCKPLNSKPYTLNPHTEGLIPEVQTLHPKPSYLRWIMSNRSLINVILSSCRRPSISSLRRRLQV